MKIFCILFFLSFTSAFQWRPTSASVVTDFKTAQWEEIEEDNGLTSYRWKASESLPPAFKAVVEIPTSIEKIASIISKTSQRAVFTQAAPFCLNESLHRPA